MKESIRRKLEQASDRYQEITALLSEAGVQNDQDQYRALTKEYAQIEPVVQTWHQYVALEHDIESANEMLADPEMAELAEEELKTAEQRRELLEPELQALLMRPSASVSASMRRWPSMRVMGSTTTRSFMMSSPECRVPSVEEWDAMIGALDISMTS